MKKIRKNARSTRIAILDENEQTRENLKIEISGERERGLTCVGCYASVKEAIKKIPHDRPAFLIMDINQPNSSGSDDVQKIKEFWPKLQIIILTDSEDNDTILGSFRAGASGYLLKQSSSIEIFSAVKELCEGGAPMSGLIARKVVQMISTIHEKQRVSTQPFPLLSSREKTVITHLSEGFRYQEIADAIGTNIETVRIYVRKVYTKLAARTRTEAVSTWLNYMNRGD